MHTPNLTDLAAPALEKVAPALEKVGPTLDRVTDHLPHQVTDHLPHAARCSRTTRVRRFASGHRRGVLTLGVIAALGAVAGWFVTRRRADAAWAPSHSGASGAPTPASGYGSRDAAASGSAGSTGGAADRGADDGFGGAAVGATPETSEGPYGAGSASPLDDGAAPGAAYTIKGEEASKVFHTRESPDYASTTADVWFGDVESARAAGFVAWDDK